jgi:hypothetical protein
MIYAFKKEKERLFCEDVKVSQQARAKGQANQDRGQDVFVVIVHAFAP